MPDLMVDDIPEMLVATQADIQRDNPVFEATDLQEYYALDQMMRKGRAKKESGNGTSVQVPIVLDVTNRAEGVTLTTPDRAQFGHTADMIDVPWRHSRTNYAYERRLLAMNSGSPERIYDYLVQERNAGWQSFYDYLERVSWGFTPATNTIDAWGIGNWIVYNATEGFNGGTPTGYNDVAGVSHAKYKNYTAQYTNVTADNFMRLARRMKLRTGFKSPKRVQDYYDGVGDQNQYYTDLETLMAIEALAESRNENLGWSIGWDGRATFGRNPINWVPAFDGEFDFAAVMAASSNPFFQINWSSFGYVFLKGDYLHEEKPTKLPDRHNWFGVWVDLTHNSYCDCRKRQGLLAKADPFA